ncbi:MAG: hypothetical protein U0531_16700 [Dehalococcoidia bacterium]
MAPAAPRAAPSDHRHHLHPQPGNRQCSPEEQALWDGDLAAWTFRLANAGRSVAPDSLIEGWLQYRADRGEVFGNALLAIFTSKPYLVVTEVQHGRSAGAPNPHVAMLAVGGDRDVGGWTVETDTGAIYRFPDGFTLPDGVCRVYAEAGAAAADTTSTCPNAVFGSADRQSVRAASSSCATPAATR